MTNFIESIKEGFSIIKEELEELDRRTDFNRLFLDKMLNKMNLLDDNADILEYLDVDDSDDYGNPLSRRPYLSFFAAAAPLLFLFLFFLFFVFYSYFFLAYYICI